MEELFFGAVAARRDSSFVLGGDGWDDQVAHANLRYLGHVPPGEHNAFNCTPAAVLNVTRDRMVGQRLLARHPGVRGRRAPVRA